ncbi:MAG: hypothetical protein ABWY25_03555 [Paenisporosarcina sp.]
MLKREITYENYDGTVLTETFYFNLTKSEIVELEVGYQGGLEATLRRIIDAKDNKTLIAEFKRLVLLSYGVKSEDGKRFVKSDQLREEFSQTAAYDTLFMELATDDDAAATFIKGVVPKDLSQAIEKAQTETIQLASKE